MPVQYPEIVDQLAHEFLLTKMKRELDDIHDPEQLRRCILTLVDLAERQKAMFKQMFIDMVQDCEE